MKFAFALVLALVAGGASAGEKLTDVTTSGDWGTALSRDNDTGHLACIAYSDINAEGYLLLTFSETGFRAFAFSSDSWSLMTGDYVDVTMIFSGSGGIVYRTLETVNSDMMLGEFGPNGGDLVGKLTVNRHITVVPASGAPVIISLNGSSTAINKWIDCMEDNLR